MKTLLNISKPKGRSFIFWEHLLKSVVAFIGTFAMLFFGPMMLGSKSRGVDAEDRLSYTIIKFIIEHPEIQIGLSVLAVVIINIYIIFKNHKIKHITHLAHDENHIQIELTNLYFSKTKKVEIPTANFEYSIEKLRTYNNEKRLKIIFRNKSKNTIIGEINPKHSFWSEHLIQLKGMIQELNAYRKEKTVSK